VRGRRSRRAFAALVPLCGAVLLALSGCAKKPDVKTQVSELEKAFPAAAAATPAPVEAPAPTQSQPADASAYVQVALQAVHTNDYAASVLVLQGVQRLPGMTAQQLMAVERAKQAMVADLVARAARGDPRAKAALAAIEKTLSQ